MQPVDAAISWLRGRPAGWAVADLGCGDARVAAALGARRAVHSFDLVATVPGVVACNMARLPLGDASVDVAVSAAGGRQGRGCVCIGQREEEERPCFFLRVTKHQ